MAKVPKNILRLSPEDKREFIDSFDLVLNDCDGVLWTLTGSMPGIKEGLATLYQLNKEVGFVTNNSITTKEKYKKKFGDLVGVKFDYEKHLIHPAMSMVAYLKSINFDKTVFLIGGPVHKQLFEEHGIKYVVAPDVHNTHDVGQFYKNLFVDIIGKEDIGAVAFEVDLDFNIGKFWFADYFLQKNPDCLLLLGGTEQNYYIIDHNFPGCGLWINNLLERVKQKPIGLGKPGAELGPIIMEKFGIKDKSRVLFVGDMLEQDIGFANRTGFQTLLVLSGMTSERMMHSHDKEDEIPDYYAESLKDFVQFKNEMCDSKL